MTSPLLFPVPVPAPSARAPRARIPSAWADPARPHFVAEPAAPAPAPEPPARPKPTHQVTTPVDRPVLSARRPAAPKRAAKPAPGKTTPARSTADELDEATINRVLDYVFGGEE